MKKSTALSLAVAVVAIVAAGLSSCSKHTTQIASSAAYANFETRCLGTEQDGSQTLRAWGKGVSKADAIEQAKKNAVADVLFKGIKDNGPCNTTPLVREETGNQASRLEAKGTSINNWGVIVTVDREGLRQQLEKDGVLKPGTRN